MQSNQAQGTLVTVLMPFDIVPLVGRFPLPVKTGKAYATNAPPARLLYAAGSPMAWPKPCHTHFAAGEMVGRPRAAPTSISQGIPSNVTGYTTQRKGHYPSGHTS